MRPQALLLLLLLIPAGIAAQDMPFAVKDRTRYSTSGMIGYETIDDIRYYQLRLIQEFSIWKIGFGLDLDFLFDEDRHLREEDWDNLQDALDKVYYLSYGGKDDPFYVHLGGFPSVTIGNGLIMQKYSNMLLYPDLRNTGLMLGGSPHWPGNPSFELFSSNLRRNQILAFSARFSPLPDTTRRVVDKLSVGVSAVVDRNQYGNLKFLLDDESEAAAEGLPSDPVSVLGLAYTLPLVETEKVTFGQYAEFAHIAGNGSGVILPGLYAGIKNVKLNLEYRVYGSRFTPAFFDHDYEEQRASQPDPEETEFLTKEESLQSVNPAQGFNGRIEAFLFKKVKGTFAWQNLYGRGLETGKSIWLNLWVDTQYKSLENFSLAYNKTNTSSMGIDHFIEPQAEIKLTATFRVYKNRWYAIGRYSERYKDDNADGVINWWDETRHSAAVGLKYQY